MQSFLNFSIPKAEHNFNIVGEVWIVIDPFWAVADVIIESLMAEEQIVVAPPRSHQARLSDDHSNFLLVARGASHRVHVVDMCLWLNSLQLVKHALTLFFVGEIIFATWNVRDGEWEDGTLDFRAVVVVPGEVRVSKSSDEASCRSVVMINCFNKRTLFFF